MITRLKLFSVGLVLLFSSCQHKGQLWAKLDLKALDARYGTHEVSFFMDLKEGPMMLMNIKNELRGHYKLTPGRMTFNEMELMANSLNLDYCEKDPTIAVLPLRRFTFLDKDNGTVEAFFDFR